jgi:Ca-activated chloride channel family protein
VEEVAVSNFTNHFAHPEFLWILLLALPLATALFFWSWRVKQRLIGQFVQARLLPALTVGVSSSRQKFRIVLSLAALGGILAALAGPRWGTTWEEARQRGLDIVVAVDTSRSMLARDAAPNRLEKAKLAAFDLMRQAKEDRMGIVAFAGAAFLQCPLTLDDEAFRQGVQALNVGIVPQGGTALSEAIRTGLGAFEKGNGNHKVLVLFTDGEDHDEDAETLAAAKDAAEAGMRIFTVGVGTAAGELLQEQDGSFIKDEDGNAVKSHLNEELLRKIATETGGFYIPLKGADPMQILYSQGLAPLPKSESTTKLTQVHPEHYHWFLGFAVLCLMVEMLMPDGARPTRTKLAGSPNHAVQKAAMLLCLFLIPSLAFASGPGAYNKYESGDYEGAFKEYNRLAEQKTNDYRLTYNAGTAAYKAKDLEAAEKQLSAALNTPEITSDLETQERAYYNLGNTLFHIGEPVEDAKEKQQRWEQSIANYSRALRLNTNDVDARNNLAFVQRKLEELKQQQQQQQQDQKKDDKNQDQKDQDQKDQDQQKQDQSKQDQQKQDQQNQQKQDQKNQSGQDQKKQQNQPDKKDQQQQQQQQQQAKDQQKKSDQAKAGQKDQGGKQPDQDQQAGQATAMPMTLQQAKQLLDAQKDDEQALIFGPENPPQKNSQGKFKDW